MLTQQTGSYTLRVVLCTTAVLMSISGCSQRTDSTASEQAQVAPPLLASVDPGKKERIVAAKDALFGKLSGRLMEVLQTQGPAAAIMVCSQEAPQFAQQVGEDHQLSIGRTSEKLRNPKNVGPDWLKPVLLTRPMEPQFFQLAHGGTGAVFPIKLQATCMLCHGPEEMILDEVKAELAKYYPGDRAKGYQEGDLRGWFWIDMPASADTQ